jgi:glycosyltransferase involved in cell wall biosynthesis
MATFNDFDGCYFSVQDIRLALQYSNSPVKPDLSEVEFVIVDNAPGSSHSQMLQGLCANTGAKYVALQQPQGTSPSRNKVFEEATGEFVLCIDSHVLLVPGAIERLLKFIPEAGDHLYSGPMILDNLQGFCTQFNPVWRAEMFGIWGRAWQCPCGQTNFTVMDIGGMTAYYQMPTCENRIGACGGCGKTLDQISYGGHEANLLARGYKSLGMNVDDEPFEIPGQGLGLFGCRRESWLHFTPHAVGFGAEELNIHELYRQRGRKCISLPFLAWLHKFGRPNGVPYPLQKYHKARNYVLWHNQLGKPLTDIYDHFVPSRMISPEDWEYLIADPVNRTQPPCPGCKQPSGPLPEKIEDAYVNASKTERDFNQHMPKLRELADGCSHVTDISIRQESFIALAASKAETVVSYSNEHGPLTDHVAKLRNIKRLPSNPRDVMAIAPTDLLFLNTTHTANQVYKELTQLAPSAKHYIILHNTQIYGEMGEDATPQVPSPGILVACRRYMRENPQWSVIYHTNNQYGLTVLSCRPEDKKALPNKLTMLGNFAKALADHVLDGNTKADLPVMEARLDICMGCEYRTEENCSVCGCPLKDKASWRSSDCPLGKWPAPVASS